MSKNINLQKSREIATAARLFGGLTCRLASMVTDERISRKEDVIRVGIPGTIQAIDHMLDLQRQMLVVGHSFAQFLATHPDVPGLVPHDFACGITERDVLTYVCGVIVGDEGADAAGDTLFGVIEYALPTIENEHHEPHLTRVEALSLLADGQANVDILGKIRDLLAPLTDEAPAPSAPRIVDKPRVKLVQWSPDEIVVGDRIRKDVNQEILSDLVGSIRRIGLRQPPTIRVEVDGRGSETAFLVAGLHRLEACRYLGMGVIPCWTFDGDELEAALWQLSENLHRAELSVQERAEHIATWIRLTETKAGQVVQLQIRSNGRPLDRGIAKAARELPITGKTDDAKRKTVERALKIDSMTPEAKEAVAAAGLSNNQRVLLHIASAEPEMQVRAVAAFARHDARPVHPVHREVNRLWAAWNGASETARRMFLEKVEKAGQMAAVE